MLKYSRGIINKSKLLAWWISLSGESLQCAIFAPERMFIIKSARADCVNFKARLRHLTFSDAMSIFSFGGKQEMFCYKRFKLQIVISDCEEQMYNNRKIRVLEQETISGRGRRMCESWNWRI